MALLEIHGNGESSYVSQDAINSAIQLLEDPLQKVVKGQIKIKLILNILSVYMKHFSSDMWPDCVFFL